MFSAWSVKDGARLRRVKPDFVKPGKMSRAEVLNLLGQLRRNRALTYILVSHDLAVVSRMCGRVAVMNNGKIVE